MSTFYLMLLYYGGKRMNKQI